MSQNKLKILNFNSGFMPDKGGVAIYSWQLTLNLSQSPEVEHVQVVAFNVSEAGEEEVNEKYNIIRIKRGTINFLTLGLKILKYLIKFKDYQVVHATNFFPVGFWVMLGTKLLGKKYFITIYGTDTLTHLGSKKTKWLKKVIMLQAAAVFSISHSTTDKTVTRYSLPKEKFITIHPGITKKFIDKINFDLKKELGYEEDDFIMLTICHLVARKGVDDIIKAVAKITDDKIKLLIVGQGPERENLENLSCKLGLEKRVKFAGQVEEVESYYNLADVFILASYWDKSGDIEGFGLVLGEAEWRRIPVIGTRSGAIPETMQEGVTGFLVNERDIDGIKEKILLLRNNPALYQKMSEAGPKFVAERFDWQAVAKKHIEVYNKFIKTQ